MQKSQHPFNCGNSKSKANLAQMTIFGCFWYGDINPCLMYRVLNKYCFFFENFIIYFGLSGLSRFFLGVYTGLHAWTTK